MEYLEISVSPTSTFRRAIGAIVPVPRSDARPLYLPEHI
jgi:hypothetical protein